MAAANPNVKVARTASAQIRLRTNGAERGQQQPKQQSKLQPKHAIVSLQAASAANTTKVNTHSRSLKSKMAAKQNVNKGKTVAAQASAPPPLELIVVGHKLHIHPLHVSPTAVVRSNLNSKVQQHDAAENILCKLRQDGEFLYVYDDWQPQFQLAEELQVVDSRFLAELIDELLLRDT